MILSIVIPTLGRVSEVDSLLKSIDFNVRKAGIESEVILVDQNFSDLLDGVVSKHIKNGFEIEHHKVSFRGLSKAKNYGAKIAKGQYVCFLDDDAEFLCGTVERAINRLKDSKYEIVSGRCVDRDGVDSVIKFKHEECVLSLNLFENRFIETTMFFNRDVCERFSYDEDMGIGAFYGAEEGYDLVYRMLREDVKILFDPEIIIYHPQTVLSHVGNNVVKRAFTYRCGYGYLCKKHKLNRKYVTRLIKVIVYLFILPCYKPKDFKYYLAEFLGLLVGRFV